MAWTVLILAGLLEIVWATALKHTDGFTRLWPSVIAIVTANASFLMLAAALRALPVGTAYAVWVGIGVVGVAAAGILLFEDAVSPLRLCFIGLIVGGVIGLRVLER
ncbi:multidrug efflux SMR transporter [soil metagenome]